MDQDPVCGMMVTREHVAGRSVHQDTTYYFCSPECKERFDRDPGTYVTQRLLDDARRGSAAGDD
jgi:Cu+-exporting ATPase